MKKIIYACAIVLGANTFAFAQDVPGFFKDTYPEQALDAAMQARGALRGEDAALDARPGS